MPMLNELCRCMQTQAPQTVSVPESSSRDRPYNSRRLQTMVSLRNCLQHRSRGKPPAHSFHARCVAICQIATPGAHTSGFNTQLLQLNSCSTWHTTLMQLPRGSVCETAPAAGPDTTRPCSGQDHTTPAALCMFLHTCAGRVAVNTPADDAGSGLMRCRCAAGPHACRGPATLPHGQPRLPPCMPAGRAAPTCTGCRSGLAGTAPSPAALPGRGPAAQRGACCTASCRPPRRSHWSCRGTPPAPAPALTPPSAHLGHTTSPSLPQSVYLCQSAPVTRSHSNSVRPPQRRPCAEPVHLPSANVF